MLDLPVVVDSVNLPSPKCRIARSSFSIGTSTFPFRLPGAAGRSAWPARNGPQQFAHCIFVVQFSIEWPASLSPQL